MPDGLADYAGFWHHAYSRLRLHERPDPTIGYLVSAFVGLTVIALAIFGSLGLVGFVKRHRIA